MSIMEHRSGDWSPGLTDQEKESLFAIAEDTLAWCVKERGKGRFPLSKYRITQRLRAPTHSFVTLKIGGELRGCIGSLPPMAALETYMSVHEHTMHAALMDPRFEAVVIQELSKIVIHVSLLSPLREISSPEGFIVGQHGIIVEKGGRSGVFLPEVAVEQNWTREQTLSCLCQHKAGLPPDAWKKGAKMKVFTSVGLSRE
jgi:AmmeMemoRadiSam system protein A